MSGDSVPTFDEGPAIPEMREAMLSPDDLERLFADLRAHTRVIAVHEKSGATQHSTEGVPDLDDVRTRLVTGTLPAAQIRYAHDGHEWTDTLIATPSGTRLVRCQHPA